MWISSQTITSFTNPSEEVNERMNVVVNVGVLAV